ncbi:MAG: hypothetical protein J1E05_05670 [Eubacterium sp.]|nr:hypothetical protein [Eubacterium sp.]
MKKNKMMRVASVLLVAVLLSTSIISGTFAKYVTEGYVQDSARVAKFGVEVTATGTLFDKTYFKVNPSAPNEGKGNTPGGSTLDENLTGTPKDLTLLSVESSNTDNLVAPGTNNGDKKFTISVTGTPEVDVNVKIDVADVKDIFLKNNAALPDMTTSAVDTFDAEAEYHPIVFTIEGDLIAKLGTQIDAALASIPGTRTDKKVTGSLSDIDAVLNAINGDNGIFVDANTDLANVAAGGIGTLTFTWEWRFEEDTNVVNAKAKTAAETYWDAQNALKDETASETPGHTQADINAAKAFIQANAVKDTYATAEGKAAAKALRDKKDTLLGDIAAGNVKEYVDGQQTTFTELPQNYTLANSSYSTDISIDVTISVTQVD